MTLRPAWSTEGVTVQLEKHKEIMSQKKKRSWLQFPAKNITDPKLVKKIILSGRYKQA